MVVSTDPANETEPIEAWVKAVESRDPRFDGWVIVGVKTTGIYCRPSCPTPVRPKPANMRFFATPAAAQSAGFRACKRCAPDSVPGSPEWNRRDDLVARAIRAIDDGEVDRNGVNGLARLLHVSPRHLNRVMSAEVGATPIALARARRARMARSLLLSTDLPVSTVAFAAGFDSIRQFNQTIREVFDRTPTAIRGRGPRSSPGDWIEVPLPYREPMDWSHTLGWLAAHAVAGVEEIEGETYRRSVHLPGGPGAIEVALSRTPGRLSGRFRLAAIGDLPIAINRVRRLLDLDADPAAINETLGGDPVLGELVAKRPGIRVVGSMDPDETLLKTILHQQVSLASAVGSAARLAADYGETLAVPVGTVERVFPTPGALARVDPADLSLPASRANALVRVASALAAGDLTLSLFANDRDATLDSLLALKGIGPWTVSIVALRGLGDPDVVCTGDLALRSAARRVGIEGDDRLVELAATWRPWRSYAMTHLWAHYSEEH